MSTTSENVERVLMVVEAAGMISLAILFPNAIRMFKPKKEVTFDKLALKQAAYYLRRKGELKFKRKNGKTCALLTEKGFKRLAALEGIRVKKSLKNKTNWDGKWRVIVFDIPENARSLRDAFRYKLKQLGCLPLQASVWVTPDDIRDEVDRLKEAGQFRRFEIQLIVADSFDDHELFIRRFKLSKK